MPNESDSCCCSISSNWCARAVEELDNLQLLLFFLSAVIVCVTCDDRRHCKVLGGRRRWRLPLQPRRIPWIVAGRLAVSDRPDQIHHRQHISNSEDRSTSCGHHIQHLKLGWIRVIAPRHSKVSKNELGKEGQVEPN